ncbi:MarR family transcriptional regulator [Protaetiibacter sp. SSC-01]|uniref:MarR family winged helix-turn-helix transcriptional regulator n=1 Tax=Protaetiibacter sp. SSC-01 TaxID=2759943 RepID=UPI001656B7D9|nr:MarR family transcriptional regulator [Protaetiibacter sp. SSC-01]QNO37588.1 MarR family transcriptional regulator [Protaetiibacter sp. SSC-01]
MADELEHWPTGRLLSVAARLVEQRWRERLDEHGLTHAGLIVLHLLGAGPQTLGDLAREARVTAQTMGRTVENLSRDGRVRIVVDPADRRRRLVERTPMGAVALELLGGVEGSMFPELDDPEGFRGQLLEIIRYVGGDPDIRYGDAR